MKKIRTRIAPSPTGSPHIGTAYAALFNYCFAKKNNGEFVLRIEDTDRTRFVEESESEIISALKWLAVVPDESPETGGNFGPYRQSERLEIYKKYIQELLDGKKAYYCNCSAERLAKVREEQQKNGEVPRYDRKCRINPPKSSENCVVRLAVPEVGDTIVRDLIRGEIVFQNKLIDDQVLMKSDGFPTYHLASVVDDHLMEISHVIRAEEWLSSTPKHVLLYEAFGFEKPEFAHLPLLRNRDRSKISKRKNPVAIDFYRSQGYLPEALRNFLGLMGWSMPNDQEIFTLQEMVEKFTFDRIDPSGPIFDIDKLDWLNGEYIRALEVDDLANRLIGEKFTKYSETQVQKVLPLVRERLKKLSEFDSLVGYILDEEINLNLDLINSVSGHSPSEIVAVLDDFVKTSEIIKKEDWNKDDLEKTFKNKPEEQSWSKTNYFQTIRTVVSGSKQTPPLFDILEEIGQEKVISRINAVIGKFKQL